MSAIRRFMALDNHVESLIFTIDTTKIVSGATNGSENPLTYCLPLISTTGCIVKVSDGRPDISLTAANLAANRVLTFSTSGIYQIKITGAAYLHVVNSTIGYDKLKLISIDLWSNDFTYAMQCFNGALNCEFLATNTFVLPANITAFFANTKGFPSKDLSNFITSKVTTASNVFTSVPTKFTRLFNPFWNVLTSANMLYSGIDVTDIQSIEIISNSVTSISDPFNNIIRRPFSGTVKIHTPNNTNIGGLCYRFSGNPPSLADVDIRNVTSAVSFLNSPFTKDACDATILGWVNNFDWSGIAPIANKVTLDFKGSTHSNITTVNNAKAFLIAKGYIFTNLTAV